MGIAQLSQVPFRYEIESAPSHLEIRLHGYLDELRSMKYLRELEARVLGATSPERERIGLLYFDGLSGFETGRVARVHGEWFQGMRPHLTRVAIITDRVAVTMALSIAKLISKTPLAQFRDETDARKWLLDEKPAKR